MVGARIKPLQLNKPTMKNKILAAAATLILASCEGVTFGINRDGIEANLDPKSGLSTKVHPSAR